MSTVRFVINTVEREKEIAAMVSEHVEFFKNNNIRFTWPEKSVEEEYDAEKYETYKAWLETEWAKQAQGFTERLLTFFHRPTDMRFTVEVSNYGPLGFYDERTNTVTINRNTDRDPVETIKHEMVHVMLEPFVQKYRVGHERKELTVTTILNLLAE